MFVPKPMPEFRHAPHVPETKNSASFFLGIVGVFCFILAAAFLIKLAIDSGWLTPMRQMGLAVFFGLTLILAGLRFRDSDVEYLSMLPGAGVVILYMTAYAGKMYYGMYDGLHAMLYVSIVSLVCFVLYRFFTQNFYVIVASIGTYMSSLLLPTDQGSQMDMMMFFIVWDVVFVVMSVWLQNRIIIFVAAYFALGIFGFKYVMDDAYLMETAVFQALQFIVFISGVGIYSIQRRIALTAQEAWAYFPLLLFFYGLEYSVIGRISENYAPWIAIAFAGVVYGIYYFAKTSLSKVTIASVDMVRAFLAFVFFHAFYLEILPDTFTPWFTIVGLGLVMLFRKSEGAHRNPIVTFVFLAIVGIDYCKTLIADTNMYDMPVWMLLNLLFFGFFLIPYFKRDPKKFFQPSVWAFPFILANVQAMFGLARLAKMIASGSEMPAAERFLVSILWGLFAIGILMLGKFKNDKLLARSSLFIFAIAALKVLLFDVSSASSVVRIFCFAALGIVFYFGGYLFRKIDSWK